jgi:hypothetical protein
MKDDQVLLTAARQEVWSQKKNDKCFYYCNVGKGDEKDKENTQEGGSPQRTQETKNERHIYKQPAPTTSSPSKKAPRSASSHSTI